MAKEKPIAPMRKFTLTLRLHKGELPPGRTIEIKAAYMTVISGCSMLCFSDTPIRSSDVYGAPGNLKHIFTASEWASVSEVEPQ